MVDDARYRTKVYLDTYLTATNMKKDDAATNARFIVAFGSPEYPLTRVFSSDDKNVDIVFSCDEPISEPLFDTDQEPFGYEEHAPITIMTVDKSGVTGTKVKWKAEAEVRRICEVYSGAYPAGSQRSIEKRDAPDLLIGKVVIYVTKLIMNYRRETT